MDCAAALCLARRRQRKRRMEGREEKQEIAEAFIDEIEENERERDLDIEDGAISDANN
jgi:hypothetical protein